MTALHLVSFAAEAVEPWLAAASKPDLPPASLTEARGLRDTLAGLLSRERAAAADFLLALAEFDRRRGWEALGHASLFVFLHRELRLSKGAAYLRSTAARLLPRFPEVEAALRDGRLCLSAVGELARVLTAENRCEVLPRFFGCSSREAREVAASLVPRVDPPRREVVTSVRARSAETVAAPAPQVQGALKHGHALAAAEPPPVEPPIGVRAHELSAPARVVPPAVPSVSGSPEAVEPLDADLRRLHLTVSKRLLDKVAAAKDALSHAKPGASTEDVLEAALDLLLESEARKHALVKRPHKAAQKTEPAPPACPERSEPQARGVEGPTASRSAPVKPHRPHIPAAIEREVRLRDQHRCQWPLDSGGTCGSTHRLQLDHIDPVAQGGESTAANLRLLCEPHNKHAARRALGEPAAAQRRRRTAVRAGRRGG